MLRTSSYFILTFIAYTLPIVIVSFCQTAAVNTWPPYIVIIYPSLL